MAVALGSIVPLAPRGRKMLEEQRLVARAKDVPAYISRAAKQIMSKKAP